MEQFFSIWQDASVDEKHRKAAKTLYEHYKRLAMCILAKEFDQKMHIDRVLTPEFIDNMFTGPNPIFDMKTALKNLLQVLAIVV